MDFTVPTDHWLKLKESEKKDKCLFLFIELKEKYETCRRWWYQLYTVHQRIGKGAGRQWNKRTSGDNPESKIIRSSKNFEKTSGDLRRFAVTQTPVENQQQTLVWKTVKEIIIIIHWEMCRKFQFDHTNKRYMDNPEPVLENDTHKLLWDFNIQTDHLIPARRLDLIIIIIMSCYKHGYSWPSLATFPYCSSPQAGLLDNILYPHIVAECMFVLVVLLLHGHLWGSIGVHHLWARPYFSSSALHVWFV